MNKVHLNVTLKGEKTSFTSNYIHGLYVVEKDILLFTPNEVVLYDTLEKTFTLLYQSESEIIGLMNLMRIDC